MEQEAIYVGIDVAKAQLDVAVRPGDDRWEVSHDDAGIGQLVPRLKALEPVMVLLEASGGLELPLVAALAAAAVPVGSSSILDRCGTLPRQPVSWPRPTPWMRLSWPTSLKRSDLPCALCGTPRRRFSTRW